MPRGLKPGMGLYRNQDQAFDKELSGKTAERKIAIKIWFGTSPNPSKGEECLTDSRGTIWAQAEVIGRANPNQASNKRISNEHPVRLSPPLVGAGGGLQLAQKPQRDNIIRQFTKLGNTVYECSEVEIVDGADKYFIPSSILAELRRMVVEELDKQIQNMQRVTIHRKSVDKVSDHKPHISMVNPAQYQQLPYLYNISNDAARKFYEQQGLTKAEPAFEIQYPTAATNGSDSSNKAFSIKGDKEAVSHLLMQCRHCIRYSLGYCVKRGGQKPTWREPLFLELPDKRRFRLEFDCKNCQMNVCNVT
jgi:peptidase, U32 family